MAPEIKGQDISSGHVAPADSGRLTRTMLKAVATAMGIHYEERRHRAVSGSLKGLRLIPTTMEAARGDSGGAIRPMKTTEQWQQLSPANNRLSLKVVGPKQTPPYRTCIPRTPRYHRPMGSERVTPGKRIPVILNVSSSSCLCIAPPQGPAGTRTEGESRRKLPKQQIKLIKQFKTSISFSPSGL